MAQKTWERTKSLSWGGTFINNKDFLLLLTPPADLRRSGSYNNFLGAMEDGPFLPDLSPAMLLVLEESLGGTEEETRKTVPNFASCTNGVLNTPVHSKINMFQEEVENPKGGLDMPELSKIGLSNILDGILPEHGPADTERGGRGSILERKLTGEKARKDRGDEGRKRKKEGGGGGENKKIACEIQPGTSGVNEAGTKPRPPERAK